MSVAVVAHCDWSMEQKKRWMAVAIKRGGRWHVQPPELVGDPASLFDRLRCRAVELSSVLGFDFPIGFLGAYARAAGLGTFREALAQFGSGIWSDRYGFAGRRDHIALHRPFYFTRRGGTARAHLFDALVLKRVSDAQLGPTTAIWRGRLGWFDIKRTPGLGTEHPLLCRPHFEQPTIVKLQLPEGLDRYSVWTDPLDCRPTGRLML